MPRPIPSLFPHLDRRTFLIASASLLGAALWPRSHFGAVAEVPKFTAYPFTLGIASGDPTPDGVVLWTRLAPSPLNGGGMTAAPVAVSWQIADDEAMTRIVQEGTSIAAPELAHSVHVEVNGLTSDRWYWYRFTVGNEISPIGRTRTLPAADAMPERLRFSVASCQMYESGYYTAYQHMLAEHCDFVFFVGDYIYEFADTKGPQSRRNANVPIFTLEAYRHRYAQFKSDLQLQAMHAAAPWFVTPDDHEVCDDYANDIPHNKKPPLTKVQFLQRRAAGYQAYYEHQPLRLSSLPQGHNMRIYRDFTYGRLAHSFILDTRQYRTEQPCGDGCKPPSPELMNPQATMMGTDQRNWLFSGLAQSKSQWNIIAQQVMMTRLNRGDDKTPEAYSLDSWAGYEHERRQLLKHLHEQKISNPIILTGDEHANFAMDLIANFDNIDNCIIASEFVGTSISSGGNGAHTPKGLDRVLAKNPCLKFYNAERGYVLCSVTEKEWRTDYRTVPYVNKPGAPIQTRASFIVEAGKAGMRAV